MVLVILLNYLTPSDTDVFYFILVFLTYCSPLPSFLPKFGAIGMGDVFGFVYLSSAISATVYYFLLGMLTGRMIYRLKTWKSHRVA